MLEFDQLVDFLHITYVYYVYLCISFLSFPSCQVALTYK